MNTAMKLSAYGAALALLFTGAYTVGTTAGPFSTATFVGHGATSGPENVDREHVEPGNVEPENAEHSGTVAKRAPDLPGGLASSRDGYTFIPTDLTLTPGTAEDFAFRIIGPDGVPVTAFDVEQDKRMHLIVVRRDTTGYQHVHPEMDADGTWLVSLTLPAGGSYRAFADFTPSGGEATTLGVDLVGPGEFDPVAHTPARTDTVDGYTVDLAGGLVPGQASRLTITVRKAGRPVTDLQPYLGAYGHLVALRERDLAYLHVHPDGGRTSSDPGIDFVAEVPSSGTYRLFLDFQHADAVRTAQFTVPTGAATAAPPAEHTDNDHGR